MQCPSCDHEIADGSQFCGFCGARLQERNETSPQLSADFDESIDTEERQESSYVGQIIDRRYQVLSMIARGGMGTVYKVVHIHMRKVLAMKLLHEHILARRKLVQRFTREARAISRLSNPHTVRVYDFGQWREVFYLAMEYLDGEDLYGVLAREGPLGVLRTVSILDQICSSLEEAHDSGIIHRDLKTENIMVLKDVDGHDFVKVLDFGLAKVMDAEERITAQSQPDLFGTPYYMAPEQIRGLTADTRVDIYALGCLAFRMLAGTFPYAAASAFETLRSHLNDPIPSVRARAPELGVPLWLDQVVQACLAKHPDGRYGSVAELRDGLRKGVESSVMGSVPEVSRGRRRRPTIPSVLPAADGGASKPPGEISTDRYADHRPYDPHQTMMELRAFKSSHRRRKIFAAVALAASIAIGGFMAWERYAPEHRSRGNEGEPNDTITQANPIAVGWGVRGHIGKRLTRTQSDVDYYKVKLPDPNPRLLDVRLDGIPNMNLALEVRDPDDKLLARIDREGVGEGERITHLPVAAHYVVASIREVPRTPGALPTENHTDPYRIWTRLSDATPSDGVEMEPNDDAEEPQPLGLERVLTGVIDTPADVDHYHLLLTERPPTVLALTVQSVRGVPLRVRLLNDQGRAHFQHTFGPHGREQTVRVARAWPYTPRLLVSVSTGSGLRASGEYSLTVRASGLGFLREQEPNNGLSRAPPLVFHSVLRGSVSRDDELDLYRVSTSADETETTEIVVHATGRRKPSVTVRPLSDGQDAGAAASEDGAVPLPLERGLGRRNWQGTMLVAHPGRDLLVAIERPRRGSEVRYQLEVRRSPSAGITALDLGE